MDPIKKAAFLKAHRSRALLQNMNYAASQINQCIEEFGFTQYPKDADDIVNKIIAIAKQQRSNNQRS